MLRPQCPAHHLVQTKHSIHFCQINKSVNALQIHGLSITLLRILKFQKEIKGPFRPFGNKPFYIQYLEVSYLLNIRNEMLLLLGSFWDLKIFWSRCFIFSLCLISFFVSALSHSQKIISILFRITFLCLYSLSYSFIKSLSAFHEPCTRHQRYKVRFGPCMNLNFQPSEIKPTLNKQMNKYVPTTCDKYHYGK